MLEKVNEIEDLDREIFSILSKEGSFRILDLASSKLAAKTGKWRELGLSKRQYYSRLRSLKDTFLIKKEGESYKLTELGEKIYGLINSLENSSKNHDPQRILDSPTEKNSSSRKAKLIPHQKLKDETKLIEIIDNYEDLVDRLVQYIKNTEEEFFLATKHTDYRVVKALLGKFEDINLKAVGSNTRVESAIQRFKSVSSEHELKQLFYFLENHTKACYRLPYSYFLSDRKYVGLEISNPSHPHQFFRAITLEGEKIYETFRTQFHRLYENTQKPSLPY